MPQKERGIALPLIVIIVSVAVVSLLLIFLYTNLNINKEKTTETIIKDVPEEVNKFFNNIDAKKFETQGMSIYKGDNPPNVDGTYQLNDLVILYDAPTWSEAMDVGDSIGSYNVRFYDQQPDGTINVDFQAADNRDQSVGTGAFISGNDNCFSIFIDSKGTADQCDYRWPEVISGCVTDGGLGQFQNGFIMKEKDGPSCEEIMPINHYRIISENDSFAEIIE